MEGRELRLRAAYWSLAPQPDRGDARLTHVTNPTPNRGMPWATLLNVGAALIYGASPIDLIPDFILVLGWLDDAIAVPLFLLFAFITYRHWKKAGRPQPTQAVVDVPSQPPVMR